MLLLLSAMAYCGELTVIVPFDGSSVSMNSYAGYTSLYSPETHPMNRPGAPALPVLPVQVALPPESRAVSITVLDAVYSPLPGRFNILPATEPVPLSLMDVTDIPLPNPDPGIYNSSETFPGAVARLESSGSLLGFPVARVSVYPVRWNPASGQIETLNSATLRVEYISDPSARTVQVRSAGSEQRSGDLVRNLVINPEGVFASGATIVESRDLAYGEYVVVTHPTYQSAAVTLANWKTRKGIPATVVTTTWVQTNYPGIDLPQKIRSFLHDARNNGVDYALIFGDDNRIAGRNVKITGGGSTEFPPVDYYWADLNDTGVGGVDQWDSNGNGVWGEYNIDNVSYYPSIFTGRASVNTSDEAATFVNKVLLYEQVSLYDRFTTSPREMRIGYSTEQLWPGCYGSVGAEIIAGYVPSGWHHDKRYESQGTNSWSATNAMFNNQRHHIYVAAHGSPTSFSVPGGSYTNSDILNLTNISSGGLPAIWNSISCLIGHLDSYECMLDAWTANPNGGGFGAANARYGWGTPSSPGNGPSEILCQKIYHSHFLGGQNTLGAMHFMGRFTLCPPSGEYGEYDHWCIMNYNLFGCPELPLWTVSPAQLTATHPSAYSGGSFTVTVTAGGSPVSGARVTLYKGSGFRDADVYMVGTTNSSGHAVFSPDPSESGEMLVTAWKYNHLSYLGSAAVTGTGMDETPEFVNSMGIPRPSPAAHTAAIPLTLETASRVSIDVYDISGRLVTALIRDELPAGAHSISWDLTTASGTPVPNGVYRIRLTTDGFSAVSGLMVLR